MNGDGVELGGGSIRIHDADLQRRVFALLGIDGAEADARFAQPPCTQNQLPRFEQPPNVRLWPGKARTSVRF